MELLGNASNGAIAAKGFSVDNGNVVGVLSNNQAFRWTASTGVVRIDPSNQGQANGVNQNGFAVGTRAIGPTVVTRNAAPANTRNSLFTRGFTGTAINNLGKHRWDRDGERWIFQ